MSTFYLTTMTVNWGRGYQPGEFMLNANRVIDFVADTRNYAIFVQELDEEPDPAHEHARLNSVLESGVKKVWWRGREPIILSPSFSKVRDRRRILTMGSGDKIGGPNGTGPARHAVTCSAMLRGVRFGFGDTHPHRSMPGHERVQRARERGEGVFSRELNRLRSTHGGIAGFWGADMNDINVPPLVVDEHRAHQRGLDHLRYWTHPNDGVKIEPYARGSLNGTIDPHDPLWVRYRITTN